MRTERSTPLEPVPSRPNMPGYGLPESPDGLMPWGWAEQRLEGSHNYWLATARRDGRPHLMLALREPIFAVRPSVVFGLDEKATLQNATRWRFST